jgi:hypothetical protein
MTTEPSDDTFEEVSMTRDRSGKVEYVRRTGPAPAEDRELVERLRFETWISAPPREYLISRLGAEAAWPGQYVDLRVQLAWEAWKEAKAVRP